MKFYTIKLAFRKTKNDKLFSVINLFGLSVSLGVCLLIVLFIKEDISYDNFYSNANRIALFRQFEGSAGSGSGFGNFLKNNIAQIEQTTRLLPTKPLITNKAGNQSFYENNFYFADDNYFKVFKLKININNNTIGFTNPTSVFISQKIAKKYFLNQNPIGRQLQYNNKQAFTVAGMLEDLPHNSHIEIDFLCPFTKAIELTDQKLDGYWDGLSLTYILLSPGTQIQQVNKEVLKVVNKTNDPNSKIWKPAFIPLRDIYLKANLDGRVKAVKAINEVYIFSAIALLILLLACFNYINLTSARAIFKAKEVGIRKIVGAGKVQIVKQFLQESVVHVSLSAIGGLLFAILFISPFNKIAHTFLEINQLYDPQFLIIYIVSIFVLALITGIYPALTLSSLKPLNIAKQIFLKGKSDFILRRLLIVTQFTVSIVIIIAVLVVSKQLGFIRNQNLGYTRDQIVTLNLPADAPANLKQTFKERLQLLPQVKSVSSCSQLPGEGTGNNKLVESFVPPGKDVAYSTISVDKDFLNVFDIKLLQGNNFSATSLPSNNEFIINASMANFLEITNNAIGKPLGYYTYQYTPKGGYKEVPVVGKIIGVVNDYHQSDLKTRITPLLIQLNQGWEAQTAIKLKSGNIQTGVAAIEKLWKNVFSNKLYEYDFLDNKFNQTYKKDTTTASALTVFAILAIMISCLGLIGLTAIMVEKRTKEIGIRKTLGASVVNIIQLLTADFILLIVIAFVLASPIAWWAMNTWLQNFAYKINIAWWMFLIPGTAALLIALATVSFQAVKAALANPVKSLRSE